MLLMEKHSQDKMQKSCKIYWTLWSYWRFVFIMSFIHIISAFVLLFWDVFYKSLDKFTSRQIYFYTLTLFTYIVGWNITMGTLFPTISLSTCACLSCNLLSDATKIMRQDYYVGDVCTHYMYLRRLILFNSTQPPSYWKEGRPGWKKFPLWLLFSHHQCKISLVESSMKVSALEHPLCTSPIQNALRISLDRFRTLGGLD